MIHRDWADAVRPEVWHAHYGKLVLAWSVVTIGALALVYGFGAALAGFAHAMVAEYMSFIVILFTLYVVAGGILVTGKSAGHAADQYRGAGAQVL